MLLHLYVIFDLCHRHILFVSHTKVVNFLEIREYEVEKEAMREVVGSVAGC